MAINYLSSINLNKNELRGAAIQNLATAPSSPVLGQVYYDTGDDTVYVCTDIVGPVWTSLSGDITSVVAGSGLSGGGTQGEVTLNIGQGNGITVSADAIAVNANLSQFSFSSGVLNIAAGGIGATELAASGVTAGSYGSASAIPVLTIDEDGRVTAASTASVSSDLTISDGTTSDTVSLLTDTLTFSGTSAEVEVAVTDNTVTIGLPSDVIIGNDLTVTGNLTVSGTTTTVNTETINLADNIITLNSNATGTPSQNAGIEVERGDSTNVSLVWDEANDRWTFTNDGSTFYNIPLSTEYNNYSFTITDGSTSQTVSNGDSVIFAAGTGLSAAVSASDTVTYSHGDTSSVADVDNSGLTVIQDLTFDGFGHVQTVGSADLTSGVDGRITAREYATSIGDGTTTAYTVTHNLGSRDVIVQLFDNSTYDTVYADVARTTVNTLTITFGAAPTSNDIRVLVTKIG